MHSKKNIDLLVEETLERVSTIDKVKTPAFFKERVLNRMVEESASKPEGVFFLNSFAPKFQAAALLWCVIVNTLALLSYSSDSYNDNVENFAEVYGLSETDTDSYLYQN
jgi:hypothetical protein